MRFPIYALAITTLLALTSCEKEIDFEYHDIPRQQVIEGLLTQDGVSVSLTKTVAIDEPFADNIVTDATVTVNDLTDNVTYQLIPDENGIFTTRHLAGVWGHDYELKVIVNDATYTSVSHMLPASEILSAEFNWIKMPYDDVAVLKVQFKADNDPLTNYWLRVYRNGEIYEWQAIESRNAVDGIVTGMMMTSRKDVGQEDEDDVLRDGDTIDIVVMPISQTMADYLDSLNNGDYNGNRMFSGAYCLGYFLAAPTSKTQITFHPDQIPYAE